jgi:hypothetical protein
MLESPGPGVDCFQGPQSRAVMRIDDTYLFGLHLTMEVELLYILTKDNYRRQEAVEPW